MYDVIYPLGFFYFLGLDRKETEIALELSADEVELYSDSELLVKQMNKEYHVRNEKLGKLHREIQDLTKNIKVRMIHVSREENREADKLANEAAENPG
jgi:ribonuclease HI